MFKPSELPVGTVIQDNDQEHAAFYWFKGDTGNWGEMFSVGNVTLWVADILEEIPPALKHSFIIQNSDEYFKDFEIVSLPFKVANWLADGLAYEERGSREEVLEYAIKNAEDLL